MFPLTVWSRSRCYGFQNTTSSLSSSMRMWLSCLASGRFPIHLQPSTATHILTHAHREVRSTHRNIHNTPSGVGTPRVIRHHGLLSFSEAMGSVGTPAPSNGFSLEGEASAALECTFALHRPSISSHTTPPRTTQHVPPPTSTLVQCCGKGLRTSLL